MLYFIPILKETERLSLKYKWTNLGTAIIYVRSIQNKAQQPTKTKHNCFIIPHTIDFTCSVALQSSQLQHITLRLIIIMKPMPLPISSSTCSQTGIINLAGKLRTCFWSELGSSNSHNPEQDYIMNQHGHKVIMFPQWRSLRWITEDFEKLLFYFI